MKPVCVSKPVFLALYEIGRSGIRKTKWSDGYSLNIKLKC